MGEDERHLGSGARVARCKRVPGGSQPRKSIRAHRSGFFVSEYQNWFNTYSRRGEQVWVQSQTHLRWFYTDAELQENIIRVYMEPITGPDLVCFHLDMTFVIIYRWGWREAKFRIQCYDIIFRRLTQWGQVTWFINNVIQRAIHK